MNVNNAQNTFVLIPKSFYESHITKSVTNENNSGNQTELKVLSQPHSSKILPLLKKEPKTKSEESSKPPIEEQEEEEKPKLEDILPLTGVKLRRAKTIVKKIKKNPRISVSSGDIKNILIDGLDSGVSLNSFLNSSQTTRKPTIKDQSVADVLNLEHYHAPSWIKIN